MGSRTEELRERAEEVRAEIADAAGRAGRSAEEITLIAVTKTFPASVVRAAFLAGLRDVGENRVQEIAEKAPELRDLELRFHMIGHLQTNKVKAVLPYISFLHSVDREHLAEEIARRLPEDRILPVFLQVNTTGEESKSGVEPGSCEVLLDRVRRHSCLEVLGLMTIGPLGGSVSENRRAFATLRNLRDDLAVQSGLELPWLSMGMSGDFALAIEEGATHVRVGSRIFGSRTAP